jgi:hypothetical protein
VLARSGIRVMGRKDVKQPQNMIGSVFGRSMKWRAMLVQSTTAPERGSAVKGPMDLPLTALGPW